VIKKKEKVCDEFSPFLQKKKKKKSPEQYGQGKILENFQKDRHIWRKKVVKLSRFLEDLGRFLAFFFKIRHI
jgi:hypothetical protein